MNTLGIAIIIGIIFPVYNWVVRCLAGSQSVFASTLGVVMALAVPVAYWAVVLLYFVQ